MSGPCEQAQGSAVQYKRSAKSMKTRLNYLYYKPVPNYFRDVLKEGTNDSYFVTAVGRAFHILVA